MEIFNIIVGIATILSTVFSLLALKNTTEIKSQLKVKIDGHDNNAVYQSNNGKVKGDLHLAKRDVNISQNFEVQDRK